MLTIPSTLAALLLVLLALLLLTPGRPAIRYLWALLLVLLVGWQPAAAQDVTHVDFQIMRGTPSNPTAAVPASAIYSYPITNFDCAVPRVTGTAPAVNNPAGYVFDDWRNTTTSCRYVEPVGGPLTVVPFSATTEYFIRASLRSSAGNGPTVDSVNSFRRPGVAPTAAPASLRVVPSQ